MNFKFIEPMFAAPLPTKKPLVIRPKQFVAEEKYDGHRLVVSIQAGVIRAWSRNGLPRVLPFQLERMRDYLPNGVYDGELFIPGKRSYGVTELVNGPELEYTIFDLIEYEGNSTILFSYKNRRNILEAIFKEYIKDLQTVKLSTVYPIDSLEDAMKLADQMWAVDKEGLILKNLEMPYEPGKRPKNTWIKLKDLKSAILKVVGFEGSRGKINNRGPYAMIVLEDSEGNRTTVKTRNDEECRKLEREASSMNQEFTLGPKIHPAIGRGVWIEYQERTFPDNNYRHPRFDRWATEEDMK